MTEDEFTRRFVEHYDYIVEHTTPTDASASHYLVRGRAAKALGVSCPTVDHYYSGHWVPCQLNRYGTIDMLLSMCDYAGEPK